MNILVQWRALNPIAAEVVGRMEEQIKYPLVPHYDERLQRQGIAFECGSLQMRITADLRMNGMIVANQITQWLWDNYRIHGERSVNGMDIGSYACELELGLCFLEFKAQEACRELKKTRRWFGDKRIQKIRLDLEKALEKAMATPLR